MRLRTCAGCSKIGESYKIDHLVKSQRTHKILELFVKRPHPKLGANLCKVAQREQHCSSLDVQMPEYPSTNLINMCPPPFNPYETKDEILSTNESEPRQNVPFTTPRLKLEQPPLKHAALTACTAESELPRTWNTPLASSSRISGFKLATRWERHQRAEN